MADAASCLRLLFCTAGAGLVIWVGLGWRLGALAAIGLAVILGSVGLAGLPPAGWANPGGAALLQEAGVGALFALLASVPFLALRTTTQSLRAAWGSGVGPPDARSATWEPTLLLLGGLILLGLGYHRALLLLWLELTAQSGGQVLTTGPWAGPLLETLGRAVVRGLCWAIPLLLLGLAGWLLARLVRWLTDLEELLGGMLLLLGLAAWVAAGLPGLASLVEGTLLALAALVARV